MKILVTGSAGFIGYHLVKALMSSGNEIVGIDNINDYYDVNLKYGRLNDSGISRGKIVDRIPVVSNLTSNYRFIKIDLTDNEGLKVLFDDEKFDIVCHLAAQAGVRYSLTNPQAYLDSNIQGFLNILECCRHHKIKHLIYASSSSVYGLNKSMPFSTHNNVDHPVSLYAASKKSNELMAHTYSHLFNLRTTGLRFFTVYGDWGRPDMAIFLFTKAIMEGQPVSIFNEGNMKRGFTHVQDIVQGLLKILEKPAQEEVNWNSMDPDPASSSAPYNIYNIGKGSPIRLLDFVSELEKSIGLSANKQFLPMQDGDVEETWADITDMKKDFDYNPTTDIKEGILAFVKWYKKFYKVSEISLNE